MDFLVLVLLIALVAILVLGVISILDEDAPEVTSIEMLPVPGGFTFLGASAYGQYFETRTLYLQSKISGEVFEMSEDGVLKPIFVPEGFEFVDGSAYGQYFEVRTIYLRQLDTGQIFVMRFR